MSRDNILHKVRTALGRSAGQAVAEAPPVRLRMPEVPMEDRIALMRMRIETLAGKTAPCPDDGGGARVRGGGDRRARRRWHRTRRI